MAVYPASVVSTHIRQGASYARGTSIDALIDDDLRVKLYAGWKPEWPEQHEFHGGEYDITCEMVLQVPENALASVFGRRAAARLIEAARRGAGE